MLAHRGGAAALADRALAVGYGAAGRGRLGGADIMTGERGDQNHGAEEFERLAAAAFPTSTGSFCSGYVALRGFIPDEAVGAVHVATPRQVSRALAPRLHRRVGY